MIAARLPYPHKLSLLPGSNGKGLIRSGLNQHGTKKAQRRKAPDCRHRLLCEDSTISILALLRTRAGMYLFGNDEKVSSL